MKYKVGDKVLVEAEIQYIDSSDCNKYPYKVLISGHLVTSFSEDELRDASKIYEDGLNDAWELAKKIYYHNEMSRDLLLDVFGACNINTLFKRTPQELVEKLKAYEESKVIKVGDVVEIEPDEREWFGVVIGVYAGDNYYVLEKDGEIQTWNAEQLKKTGRHIDISSILEQIRGNE